MRLAQMVSLKRLFTLSQPPEQISERAWRSLRLAHRATVVLLALMGLFCMTVFAALFIPRQIAETAVLSELALMMVESILAMTFGVWSLYLRLMERFKVGNIQILGAIMLGSGMAGILVLIGILYLVTR